MKKLTTELIDTINEFYIKHKDYIDEKDRIKKTNYTFIGKFIKELEEIYDGYPSSDKQLSTITQKQQEKYKHIYDQTTDGLHGAFVHIWRDKSRGYLFNDIMTVSFSELYPRLIWLMYKNNDLTFEFIEVYTYIVEHHDEISSKVNEKVYRMILNYVYGRNHIVLGRVVSFQKIIMKEILELDMFSDIVYIDSDTVYFWTDEEYEIMNKIIEYNEDLLVLDIDKKKYNYYFIQKQSFIKLSEGCTYMGIEPPQVFKNKKIKNKAYLLYLSRGGDLPFIKFLTQKNRDGRKFYRKFYIEAKLKLQRDAKMKRIM